MTCTEKNLCPFNGGIKYSLLWYECCTFRNADQCEDGTTNKPCGGGTVATDKHSADVFHCDICGKIFLKKVRLVTHIEQHASPSLK